MNITRIVKTLVDQMTTNKDYVSITTDSASNMFRRYKNPNLFVCGGTVPDRTWCWCHVLHNCLKKIVHLPIVERVRKTTAKILSSSILVSQMATSDAEEEKKKQALELDTAVRWSSTIMMLDKFHHRKDDILYVCSRVVGACASVKHYWS